MDRKIKINLKVLLACAITLFVCTILGQSWAFLDRYIDFTEVIYSIVYFLIIASGLTAVFATFTLLYFLIEKRLKSRKVSKTEDRQTGDSQTVD